MKKQRNDIIMQNKIFLRILLATGVILSIPLIATLLSNEVAWSAFDFILMGGLLLAFGFGFVALARITPRSIRLPLFVGMGFILVLIWVHLAVGIVDTWPFAGS